MMNFKQQGIDGNVKGVEFLMKKNKIDVIAGKGRVLGTGKVEVSGGDLAGAEELRLAGDNVDLVFLHQKLDALTLPSMPCS